jgi:hypothetical protein
MKKLKEITIRFCEGEGHREDLEGQGQLVAAGVALTQVEKYSGLPEKEDSGYVNLTKR